jgi:hypothetical protein
MKAFTETKAFKQNSTAAQLKNSLLGRTFPVVFTKDSKIYRSFIELDGKKPIQLDDYNPSFLIYHIYIIYHLKKGVT